MTTPTLAACSHHFAEVNGVRLHYVKAGAGPLVVLLHGFPEFWYSWRHQIVALAGAGYRVVAPDLRGYNESDKPQGIERYRLEVLIEDVAGLIHHAGEPRATVVGHDWGGAIAWWLAMHRPNVVHKLAILNAPHPGAYFRELRRPAQLLRSWYVFFFQLPWFPEALVGAAGGAFTVRSMSRETVRPGAFSAGDLRQYAAALCRPGVLTASINYYRAALRHVGRTARAVRPIAAPTLLIWGTKDRYLSPRLIEGLTPWVPDLRIALLNASHWVQNDAPEEVNRLLIEFLTND